MSNEFGGLSALESARQGIANKLKIENAARISGGRTAGGYGGGGIGAGLGGIIGRLIARRFKLPGPVSLGGAMAGGIGGAAAGRPLGAAAAELHNTDIPDYMTKPVEPDTIAPVSSFIQKQSADVVALLTSTYLAKHADGQQIDVQGLLKRLGDMVASHPTASGAIAGGTAGLLSGTSLRDRLRRAAGGAAIGGAMGYGGRMAYDSINRPPGAITSSKTHAYPGGQIDNSKLPDALQSDTFKQYKEDPGPGVIQQGIKGGVGLAASGIDQTARSLPGTATGAVLGTAHNLLTPNVPEATLGMTKELKEGAKGLAGSKNLDEASAASAINRMTPEQRGTLSEKMRAAASAPTDTMRGRVSTALKQNLSKWNLTKKNVTGATEATTRPTPIDTKTLEGIKAKTVGDLHPDWGTTYAKVPMADPKVSLPNEALGDIAGAGAKTIAGAGKAEAAAAAGLKAPKMAAPKPLQRGLFTGNISRGGRMGRFLLPTAIGAGADIARYLTTDTTPQQQARLGDLKKIVGK